MRRRAEDQARLDIEEVAKDAVKKSIWSFLLGKVIEAVIKAVLELLSKKYTIYYKDEADSL